MNMRIRAGVTSLAVTAWLQAVAGPPLINYQGRLLDGTNLMQGSVALDINLYPAPEAVMPVYRDTGSVIVVDGLYSTLIGDGAAWGDLADALTNETVFLEVVVNGTPLAPRERLTSVPYAFVAASYEENDPKWLAASSNYLTVVESSALFATGTPVYAESDPVWLAISTGYLSRTESITLFATGTPVYVETDPVWLAASSNYLTAVESSALFATGTPVYAESDPAWLAVSTGYLSRTESISLFATGTPVYVEADPRALLADGTRAMTGNLNLGARAITNIVAGGLVFTNGLSVTQVFVKIAGDTMGGRLNLPAGGLAVGATQLVVLTNGFVGIGTATPTNHLAVNGSIKAREVIVTPDNWPDYVFAPGYELAPLADVEKFIAQNGHLPGLPSAKAVGQTGVALGDMQERLLRKIEELTLYMIELRKENEELRRMIGPGRVTETAPAR